MVDATNETKGMNVTGTTEAKYTPEWWGERSAQIDRVLKPIEEMDADELAAYRRILNEDLQEASAWTEQCRNALLRTMTSEKKGNARVFEPVAAPTETHLARKLQPLKRALSRAEASERRIRHSRNQVGRQMRIVERREAAKAAEERSERIEAEQKARQEELDRQAVEAVQTTPAGRKLLRWGRSLVKVQD